ncbi:MAG: protoheme IX farnesyltransferase [Bacteroidales bacterium]|nr:protoheme IX farnesyltransferase [Bacteroidales bacterium]
MILNILRLIKYKLSLAVTITCISSYILYKDKADILLILTALAVFLLAAGMSALNQYQERRRDSLMKRTAGRPVPSGKIKPPLALTISFILILTALVMLLYIKPWSLILAIIAIALYNGLYTWLKTVSYLSIIPGALVGAIPPLIGWQAAGGSLPDPAPLYLAFLMFMWQIPHFWILLIIHREDYKAAGFPTILKSVNIVQATRISYVWICLSALFAISYNVFGIYTAALVSYIVVILSLVFLVVFFFFLLVYDKPDKAFILSNVFISILFLLFATGKV